jgi:hypothetical protein
MGKTRGSDADDKKDILPTATRKTNIDWLRVVSSGGF